MTLSFKPHIYHLSFKLSVLRGFSNFPGGSVGSSTMKLAMVNFNTDRLRLLSKIMDKGG